MWNALEFNVYAVRPKRHSANGAGQMFSKLLNIPATRASFLPDIENSKIHFFYSPRSSRSKLTERNITGKNDF